MHRKPMRIAASLISTGLVVAACGTAASTQSGASGGGSASQSMAASPTAASLKLSFPDGEEPTVTRELAGIDEQYINPGAVIESDGTLHMFANVFTAWPGRVQVPHLTSQDGATWTLVGDGPVLSSDDVPLADPGADISTGFIADDGTWVLIYETVAYSDPWVIGRITAPGPDGPWTVDPDPILEPGPAGAFDHAGLAWPSVVRTDDGYLMFYTGMDVPRGTGAIGLATSEDGVTWTRREEPVLTAEADWEGGSLDRPRVAVAASGLAMVYAGADLTDRGLAWSQDGISWQRDGDEPVLTDDDLPGNFSNCWDAALVAFDGTLSYYLEVGSTGSRGTQVYRATADLE